MRRIYRFLTLAAIALPGVVLTGCGGWEPVPPPVPPSAQRVFLMYDNINDHSRRPFEMNVVAAGKAVAEGALDSDERVIVFHRSYRMEEYSGARSVIYELVRDASQPEGYRREMVRVYDAGQYDTLSSEVIASVVGDIRNMIPADHYGLSFGSHGKGWQPKDSPVTIARDGKGGTAHPFAFLWEKRSEDSMTRFLEGYNQRIDVSEFIDGLDEWKWDFIILDDCFMASVETLYDMRDLADYIIASPTEIIITGFPYTDVIGILFDDWSENGLKAVAEAFVEAYRQDSMNPGYPYATIAVVKMDEMAGLAGAVKKLELRMSEVSSIEGLQYYERYTRPGHVFFDLDDYLGRIRKDVMPTEYNAFVAQMERTVVFKDHTEYFFSEGPNRGTVKIDHFSGVNVFIPWAKTALLFPEYRQTEWFKAVYADQE